MRIADKIITIVCDDIRHEMGNKMSIMGMYDDLIVKDVPNIIPKINLAVLLKKLRKKFTSIRVSLKSPDGESIELPEMSPSPGIKTGTNYNMDICVAPLKIEKLGTFVWELRFDGEEKPSITHEMNIRTLDNPKPPK